MDELDRAILNNIEGVIIKNLESKYILGERLCHWIKLKPDHVDGMMDDLDLVILGNFNITYNI